MQGAKLIKYQEAGKLCALNSVANGVDIPQALYTDIKEQDPALEQVVGILQDNGVARFRKPKGVQRTDLFNRVDDASDDWGICGRV
jgi:hypothetical protein